MDLHYGGRTSEVIKGVAKFLVLLMDEFVGIKVPLMFGSPRVCKLLNQLLVYASAITL
jgi:hypothetical protein